jgi:Sec-independent protein translocase protein TatA
MFSIADMAVAGAVALLLFGPDQLPKVARRAGQLIRDVQNTSQSFIREMERAADTDAQPADPYPASALPSAPAYHETPEPAAHDLVAREAALDPRPGPGETEPSPPSPSLTARALPQEAHLPPVDQRP